jgi:bifunctional oligoribonuclease and PAP phosphatase NrnA
VIDMAELVPEAVLEAAEFVRRARHIAIMAHVNPDADAIGALLGLTLGLRGLGKDVDAALSDPVPDYARFLQGADTIVSNLDAAPFDLLICLDAAAIDRIGDLYLENKSLFAATPILNLDHHRTNPLYGTVNLVAPSASSSSELCFHLLSALQAPIDGPTANALLFGVVGDTGSFRNGATTPGSLHVAGDLVRLGADAQQISFQLFEAKRFVAARLWGRVISTIQLDSKRGIVFACQSQAMLREEGVSMDETEGVAEYLRGIVEAQTVMLLKETEQGDVRVSMRSRPAVDVSLIASALGGGGHRQAAGCTVPGPLDAAVKLLAETYDLTHPSA